MRNIMISLFISCFCIIQSNSQQIQILADSTTVESIIQNPGGFNKEYVTFEGFVTQYTPSTASTASYYLMRGEYGGIIKVNTRIRPQINKRYRVWGTVMFEPMNQESFIVEDKVEMVDDDDLDGVPNQRDNCPNTVNPDQADNDEDGVDNNCPDNYNPNQADKDGDGKGVVLEMSSNDQFLFDQRIIEDCVDIKRRIVEPQKYIGNPVIKKEYSWENGLHLSTIIFDPIDKIYKMWYFSQHKNNPLCEQTMHYAFSKDGYKWEKPVLNKFLVKEFGDNNIVYVDLGGKVFYDKFDDESRRFKLILDPVESGGLRIAYSAEGIDWTLDERNPYKNLKYPAIFDVVYNKLREKWQLFIRPILYSSGDYGSERDESIYGNSGNKRRRIAMCESDDLFNWTYPKIVCRPDESEENEFDNINIIQVNDLMIAFIGTFTEDKPGSVKTGQRFKAIFKYSHKGEHWEKAVIDPKTQYVKHGEENDFDSQLISLRGPLIDIGNGMQLIYYCGGQWSIPFPGYYEGGIGILQIVKDRFVEVYANEESGYILTKEFILDGNKLSVNYKTHGENGYIKVEIIERQPLDDDKEIVHGGKFIKGYTLEECSEMKGNDINRIVTWNGSSDLSKLRGKAVCLRFFIKNAGIYTFKVYDK